MTTRIFRYQVPVDGHRHKFDLHGDPLAVGCRVTDVVEFWAYHHDANPVAVARTFTVVGTSVPLPDDADVLRHWGTAVAPGGLLVWHLLEDRS